MYVAFSTPANATPVVMLGFLLKNKGLSAVHIEHFAPARSVPGVNQERPHAAFGAATLRSTTDPALVFCSPPP